MPIMNQKYETGRLYDISVKHCDFMTCSKSFYFLKKIC